MDVMGRGSAAGGREEQEVGRVSAGARPGAGTGLCVPPATLAWPMGRRPHPSRELICDATGGAGLVAGRAYPQGRGQCLDPPARTCLPPCSHHRHFAPTTLPALQPPFPPPPPPQAADSPVCEVLGMAQRQWLRQELAASTAPLKIVASGSVPLGSVGWVDPVRGACSEDDWNVSHERSKHACSARSTTCTYVLMMCAPSGVQHRAWWGPRSEPDGDVGR